MKGCRLKVFLVYRLGLSRVLTVGAFFHGGVPWGLGERGCGINPLCGFFWLCFHFLAFL